MIFFRRVNVAEIENIVSVHFWAVQLMTTTGLDIGFSLAFEVSSPWSVYSSRYFFEIIIFVVDVKRIIYILWNTRSDFESNWFRIEWCVISLMFLNYFLSSSSPHCVSTIEFHHWMEQITLCSVMDFNVIEGSWWYCEATRNRHELLTPHNYRQCTVSARYLCELLCGCICIRIKCHMLDARWWWLHRLFQIVLYTFSSIRNERTSTPFFMWRHSKVDMSNKM